jgi:hypothetical protein
MDWYASDINLRGTPRGSRKKPNVGRSPTWLLWTADANSHMPCPCHGAPWPWEVAFRTAWSGHGMAYVNQTQPHCVNQMGKTQSKPLAARHGRGTAWYVWISLYTHNIRTYSDFPFHSLLTGQKDQKHGLALQNMRNSRVPHDSVPYRCHFILFCTI